MLKSKYVTISVSIRKVAKRKGSDSAQGDHVIGFPFSKCYVDLGVVLHLLPVPDVFVNNSQYIFLLSFDRAMKGLMFFFLRKKYLVD